MIEYLENKTVIWMSHDVAIEALLVMSPEHRWRLRKAAVKQRHGSECWRRTAPRVFTQPLMFTVEVKPRRQMPATTLFNEDRWELLTGASQPRNLMGPCGQPKTNGYWLNLLYV